MADELVQPLTPPPAPSPTHEPVNLTPELARKNMLWGWALFGLFWLLFGGTVGIAAIYLWLS